MENSLSASDISLIYPEAVLADESGLVSPHALSRQSVSALELDFLIDLKTCDIGDFFTDDAETLKYRQETFRDLSENPGICPVLRRMVPFLTDITELRRLGSDLSSESEGYLYSITEVELYISLLSLLHDELLPFEQSVKSPAMAEFCKRIHILTESDYYRSLNEKLSELSSRVREIKSVTIGVNLDSRLRPESAGVLSVNNEPFKSGAALDRILRLDFRSDDRTAIAKLRPFMKDQTENEKLALTYAFNNALGDVFKSNINSWKKVIRSYVLENTDFLIRMIPEIEFVTKAAELIGKLKDRSCPLCFPEILPNEEKRFSAEGLVNPVVALKVDDELVPNDFTFDSDGMLFVITGPNRGGKSVITAAVGLAFAMAQLGLPITAKSAAISPCDGIFTHFPQESEDTIEKGRLGEECSRLNAIFDRITGQSLVLLDESLSSTGSFEGAYIASEVLAALSLIGCRGIFSTHLHDLAASVEKINADCLPQGGVRIDNLVAEITDGRRSFRILRKMPDGKSYARDIAEKYGLSLDRLLSKIKK